MTGITKKLFRFLTAFSFSVSVVGCGLFGNGQDGVVITVGKRAITAERLRKEMRRMPFGVDAAAEGTGKIFESMVNQIIDYYLILEFGSEQGIAVSEDELGVAIRDIKRDYSEKDFQETLLQGYVDFEEWREGMRERLLLQKIIRKATEGLPPVPFQEIKAYYDSHRDEFKHPEMVKFRQIVKSSREETEQILKRLKEGKDPDAGVGAEGFGGALWVARGDLEESMERGIFSLSAGQMSSVVATPYGFHIIQVTEKRPEGVKSLPEALPEIEAKLADERKEAFYQKWLDGLRASIPVKINHKLLKNLESG